MFEKLAYVSWGVGWIFQIIWFIREFPEKYQEKRIKYSSLKSFIICFLEGSINIAFVMILGFIGIQLVF